MNATIRTLFQFLLSELDIGGYEPGLWRLVVEDRDRIGETIADTAEKYGLRTTEAELTLENALSVSGGSSPVIAAIDSHKWLVLQGFRKGRIKGAIITKNNIKVRLFRNREIAELLNLADADSRQWFLLEAKEPMDTAKNPDIHGALPPLQRLFGMLNAERGDLLLVLIFALGTGLLYLATPVAVQALVNTVALGGMFQPLVVLALILFIFLAFAGAIYVLQTYLVELIQRRLFVGVSADLAYRLPRINCEVYDRYNGVELVNRFFDVMTIQKSGATLLLEGIATILQAIIGLLVLAAYHPLLLVFDLVLIGLIAFIVFFLGRTAIKTAIEESKAKYALVAWLQTIVRGLSTFKFAGGPEFARQRADELAHTYLANRKRHYRVVLRQTIGAVSLHAVAGTSLLAIGGLLVVEGQLTLGQLVAAELIVSGVLSAFAKFGKQLEGFYDLMAGVDKVGHLIDLPLERENGEKIQSESPADLKVIDLAFAYHSRYRPIEGLSFKVRPNENVAVLCSSGGGKTTLADLLGGLRLPMSGRVELNGIDLRDLRLESLREQIAIVGRLEFIEDTVIENIRLGRSEISNAAIRQVLDELGLLKELLQLPDSLQTEVIDGGAPLSSSQFRRLLIARAIVSRPRLLVIDGLLDELDENVRDPVFRTLFKADRSWTLLILTRFPAVAEHCQQIIEFPVKNAYETIDS